MKRSGGFTLIELMMVVLIVGILAAVSVPLYLGYIRDAKMAEGKALVGSLWTSIQSDAIANCGVATPISGAFPRAGFDAAGQQTPARWSTGNGATMTVSCTTGAYVVSRNPLFVVTGVQADVQGLAIGLFYDANAVPPSVLRCSNDGGVPSTTSPAC